MRVSSARPVLAIAQGSIIGQQQLFLAANERHLWQARQPPPPPSLCFDQPTLPRIPARSQPILPRNVGLVRTFQHGVRASVLRL